MKLDLNYIEHQCQFLNRVDVRINGATSSLEFYIGKSLLWQREQRPKIQPRIQV